MQQKRCLLYFSFDDINVTKNRQNVTKNRQNVTKSRQNVTKIRLGSDIK